MLISDEELGRGPVERKTDDMVSVCKDSDGENIRAYLYREDDDGNLYGWMFKGRLNDFPTDFIGLDDLKSGRINHADGKAVVADN